MPDVIVPRKCVGEIRKLLDEAEGNVEISLSASKVRFQLGNAVLTSKLIDGTFPDYSRVIPTANDKLLKVRSEEHTSELQSLMRLSYAVFCLTKKNKTLNNQPNKQHTKQTQQ